MDRDGETTHFQKGGMNIFIVTGASRGLGAALAEAFSGEGNRIFAVSRSKPADNWHHIKADLSDSAEAESVIGRIMVELDVESAGSLTLVNNAGVLGPINRIDQIDRNDVVNNLATNMIAPAILAARFIEATSTLAVPKTIINITSGAASNPYDGWSLYCASKAGLDLFTRCVAREQEQVDHPVSVVNINPGVMDTQMQVLIRQSTTDQFSSLSKFLNLHENNQLSDPAQVASEIARALKEGRLQSGETYKVADWLSER